MNVKPTEEATAALARMGRGAEWEAIEAWLSKWREACVQTSLTADDIKSRQAQGALMAIDEFVRQTRAAVELSTRR